MNPQILKDDKKRATYDQYGAASTEQGFDPNAFSRGFGAGAGGFPGFHEFSFGSGGGQGSGDLFESLFSTLTGGRGRGSGFSETRGDDVEVSLGISFLDACKGATRNVSITPVVDCGTCSGSGMKDGAQRSTCHSCRGSGTRTFVLQNGFQMASTCTACDGHGSTIPRNSQCSNCRGVGKVRTKKNIQVEIPPGKLTMLCCLSRLV